MSKMWNLMFKTYVEKRVVVIKWMRWNQTISLHRLSMSGSTTHAAILIRKTSGTSGIDVASFCMSSSFSRSGKRFCKLSRTFTSTCHRGRRKVPLQSAALPENPDIPWRLLAPIACLGVKPVPDFFMQVSAASVPEARSADVKWALVRPIRFHFKFNIRSVHRSRRHINTNMTQRRDVVIYTASRILMP